MQTTNIKIDGMTCGGCARSVTAVLAELSGMEKVEVSLDQAMATVIFDPAKLDLDAITDAVTGAGYDVVGHETVGHETVGSEAANHGAA